MATIKLGDVLLDAVVKELPSINAEITDKPVESGQDISDHLQMKPTNVELTGTMVEDAANKLRQLKKYQAEAELLTYIGRNIFKNMVIQSIDTDHAVDTIEGYHYTIRLKQVRVAELKTFQTTVNKPATKKPSKKTNTKVKKKTNVGRVTGKPKKAYVPKAMGPVKPMAKVNKAKRMVTPPSLWQLKGIG